MISSIDARTSFRQVGKEIAGRLIKGYPSDPVQAGASSIPYKFETILYKNNNPKGFDASSHRFFSVEEMNPGPGTYNTKTVADNSDSLPSYSKKGLGNGFVSRTQRVLYQNFSNTGPGPGSYDQRDKVFVITNRSQTASFMSSTVKNKIETIFHFR